MNKQSQPRILIICRRTNSYKSLIEALSTKYSVTVCVKCDDIKKRIEKKKFDLLIMEHATSEKIILQTLEDCKSVMHQGTRVILLDGHPGKEFIAKAFGQGLFDYFPTPVQQELLIDRINGLLKKIDLCQFQ